LFERPEGGEIAIVVHLNIGPNPDRDMGEFEELVASAGAKTVATVLGARSAPDPKYFMGKGKAEELANLVLRTHAELVILDHILSPAQERNLEQLLKCRVLDRTGLILDIFAQRARSFEGKLQVELAQLKHLSTRLVRGWTHLERQKGGIGLRGPGETQLEVDKRLIAQRMKHITKRLEKVRRQRQQGRRSRQKVSLPTVTLVGYTNVGKSTLFNQLCRANVYTADQLFATLDSTLRRVDFGDAGPAILVDTVGFLKQLPHDLIAAFRSTLEETVESDLLLHVIDATSDERGVRVEQVNSVLKEIGAGDIPQIEIYNKIDGLHECMPRCDEAEDGQVRRIWLSAKTGEGVDLIPQVLRRYFGHRFVQTWVKVLPDQGRIRAQLYGLGAVTQEKSLSDGGYLLEINLQQQTLDNFAQEGMIVIDDILFGNGHLLAGVG